MHKSAGKYRKILHFKRGYYSFFSHRSHFIIFSRYAVKIAPLSKLKKRKKLLKHNKTARLRTGLVKLQIRICTLKIHFNTFFPTSLSAIQASQVFAQQYAGTIVNSINSKNNMWAVHSMEFTLQSNICTNIQWWTFVAAIETITFNHSAEVVLFHYKTSWMCCANITVS